MRNFCQISSRRGAEARSICLISSDITLDFLDTILLVNKIFNYSLRSLRLLVSARENTKKLLSVIKMKKFYVLGILLLCAAPLFSAPLDALLGPEPAAALVRNSGTMTEVQLKSPQPVLLPRHDSIRKIINDSQNSLQPSVMVESLFLYQKPQAAAQSGSWSSAERINLYNEALSISTLAGIEYFSASRNSMRIFYETSQIIDDPKTKNPLPDPVFTVIPPSFTLYARQKDLTFGDNIYRYDYYSYPDAFVFVQENLTNMNAGIIPALGKNRLRSFLAVFDAGDSLLFYAASMAKAVYLPGMDGRIGKSFTNRAGAILKWYTEKAGEALDAAP